MARPNQVVLIVGNRGSGKTVLSKKLVYNQVLAKNFPKIVVFDEDLNETWDDFSTFDHPERINFKIPLLPYSKLKAFKSGVVKMTVENDLEVEDYMQLYWKQLRNSVLFLEDASRFLEGKISKAARSVVYNSKQRNVDAYLVFHSLQDVPPRLARSCNWIVLFHTEEEKCPSKLSNPRIKNAFNSLKEMFIGVHPNVQKQLANYKDGDKLEYGGYTYVKKDGEWHNLNKYVYKQIRIN